MRLLARSSMKVCSVAFAIAALVWLPPAYALDAGVDGGDDASASDASVSDASSGDAEAMDASENDASTADACAVACTCQPCTFRPDTGDDDAGADAGPSTVNSGCSCDTQGGSSPASVAWLLFAVAAVVRSRKSRGPVTK